MIRTRDLAALGLDPPTASPGVVSALAACDVADAVWAAWIAAARVWPRAWLAALDAAERGGRR